VVRKACRTRAEVPGDLPTAKADPNVEKACTTPGAEEHPGRASITALWVTELRREFDATYCCGRMADDVDGQHITTLTPTRCSGSCAARRASWTRLSQVQPLYKINSGTAATSQRPPATPDRADAPSRRCRKKLPAWRAVQRYKGLGMPRTPTSRAVDHASDGSGSIPAAGHLPTMAPLAYELFGSC
jgi:hypothetical protein